jgi:hypothetical protein
VTAPLPAGATTGGLNAVSCTSASNCFAVGGYARSSLIAQKTLIVRWNGKKWLVVASPNPNGGTRVELSGVSCASPTMCFAVGTYTVSTTYLTLVERWNGTTWRIVASPEYDGATDSRLAAVSCPSATACFAVGSFKDAQGPPRKTLIERWNGSAWTISQHPKLVGGNRYLYGVSCPSTTSCFAVGRLYTDSDCEPELDCDATTLVEQWNGRYWAVAASPNGSGAFQSTLAGVSCASATSCVAVGTQYPDPPSSWRMLTERWNGRHWAVVPGAFPAGVTRSSLYGVSCASPTTCFAGGDYQQPGSDRTIVDRYNGTSWSIAYRPSLSGVLRGVSCTSATSCVAVGGRVIQRLGTAA